MSTLQERIQALNDANAQRILITFARHQPGFSDDPLTQGTLTRALNNAGELTGGTLLLLADDPQYRNVIEALVTGPAPQRYDAGIGAAATLDRYCVRAAHSHQIRTEIGGDWTFRIEHRPAGSRVLKSLLEKLSNILPG